MSASDCVVAHAWLNRLKTPTRNWSFCSFGSAKFLNSVRSWLMRVGMRRLYVGTSDPFSPNAGILMQLMSSSFSPTPLRPVRGSQV